MYEYSWKSDNTLQSNFRSIIPIFSQFIRISVQLILKIVKVFSLTLSFKKKQKNQSTPLFQTAWTPVGDTKHYNVPLSVIW